MCILGYILTLTAYTQAQKNISYKRNIGNFLNDLHKIRLSCVMNKKDKRKKISYQLEDMSKKNKELADLFQITNKNFTIKLNVGDYI